ncbi:MAG: DNA-3-methyladenine glycosylase 2 family protein [Lachnospiraceae bacterium]|nr:DNA-3-methyladenine glycosylase 2 family protein [Lachnospiraceae bacterium]
MIINIEDDLDLKKIADSGQAFRIAEISDGEYRFVTGDQVLYIKPVKLQKNGAGSYEISCFDESGEIPAKEAFEKVWKNYFDLGTSYKKIRSLVPEKDVFLSKSCENGIGLRILRQDPFEMLITFIISQRKAIPAIKESVRLICEKYGKAIDTGREAVYLFPSAKEMSKAKEEELKSCKLGYRVPYILDAVKKVNSGEVKLNSLYGASYEETFEKLKEIKGVGDKVSNCICLFAYALTEAAPVDTWISKVIEKEYDGVNPFPSYGKYAGIMQQYIFYYALTHKDNF